MIATEPGTRAVAKSMMLEAQAIGEKLGVRFGVDVERRIDGAAAVGAHKTSMLQDLEAGRTMEIDAMLGAIKELGELVGVATPVIDLVLALVQQRARVAGCYQHARIHYSITTGRHSRRSVNSMNDTSSDETRVLHNVMIDLNTGSYRTLHPVLPTCVVALMRHR